MFSGFSAGESEFDFGGVEAGCAGAGVADVDFVECGGMGGVVRGACFHAVEAAPPVFGFPVSGFGEDVVLDVAGGSLFGGCAGWAGVVVADVVAGAPVDACYGAAAVDAEGPPPVAFVLDDVCSASGAVGFFECGAFDGGVVAELVSV